MCNHLHPPHPLRVVGVAPALPPPHAPPNVPPPPFTSGGPPPPLKSRSRTCPWQYPPAHSLSLEGTPSPRLCGRTAGHAAPQAPHRRSAIPCPTPPHPPQASEQALGLIVFDVTESPNFEASGAMDDVPAVAGGRGPFRTPALPLQFPLAPERQYVVQCLGDPGGPGGFMLELCATEPVQATALQDPPRPERCIALQQHPPAAPGAVAPEDAAILAACRSLASAWSPLWLQHQPMALRAATQRRLPASSPVEPRNRNRLQQQQQQQPHGPAPPAAPAADLQEYLPRPTPKPGPGPPPDPPPPEVPPLSADESGDESALNLIEWISSIGSEAETRDPDPAPAKEPDWAATPDSGEAHTSLGSVVWSPVRVDCSTMTCASLLSDPRQPPAHREAACAAAPDGDPPPATGHRRAGAAPVPPAAVVPSAAWQSPAGAESGGTIAYQQRPYPTASTAHVVPLLVERHRAPRQPRSVPGGAGAPCPAARGSPGRSPRGTAAPADFRADPQWIAWLATLSPEERDMFLRLVQHHPPAAPPTGPDPPRRAAPAEAPPQPAYRAPRGRAEAWGVSGSSPRRGAPHTPSDLRDPPPPPAALQHRKTIPLAPRPRSPAPRGRPVLSSHGATSTPRYMMPTNSSAQKLQAHSPIRGRCPSPGPRGGTASQGPSPVFRTASPCISLEGDVAGSQVRVDRRDWAYMSTGQRAKAAAFIPLAELSRGTPEARSLFSSILEDAPAKGRSTSQVCVCVCVCACVCVFMDRPTGCCFLGLFPLYYRKAPSRHAFQLLLLLIYSA